VKVLLTGALGNVGRYTVDALFEEGHEVVAFDLESRRARKVASQLDGRVHVVWGDITDPRTLGAALDGVDGNARFVDDHGVERTLRDDELLGYIGLLAGAGNETTTRLIGWTAWLLDRFPDQRRVVAGDRSLVPNAIEEILRYEAAVTGAGALRHARRRVARNAGSRGLNAAAPQRLGEPGRERVRGRRSARREAQERPPPELRPGHPLLSRREPRSSRGLRGPGRGAARWTEWDIDPRGAEMARTSTVRGWKKPPARI